MKLTELKDWDKLTPAEQKRLREVYGDDPQITKTMAQPAPKDAEKPKDNGTN